MMIDIEKLKKMVENTDISYRQLAIDFGTNHTQIKKFIEKYNWNIQHRPIKENSKKEEIVPATELSNHSLELYNRLDTIGKNVFNNLVLELGGMYKPVLNYQIYLTSRDFTDYIKLSDEVRNAPRMILSKNGQPYINPLYHLYSQSRSEIRKSLNDLGLSLSIQKRLNISFGNGDKETSSIFDIVSLLSDDNDINEL